VQVAVFPKLDWSFLSWIVLVPLLWAVAQEAKFYRAFFLGMISGVVFFTGACYWIVNVLDHYGDLNWISGTVVFLVLVLYLSLFPGVFALLFSLLMKCNLRLGFLLSPFLWVATEYLRAHVLTGFPWCLLGYALADYTILAKASTVTGVYGLSFIVVLVNAGISWLVFRRRILLAGEIAIVFPFAAMVGRQLPLEPAIQRAHQPVRIVQTNITLDQAWDQESKIALLDELTRLSLSPGVSTQQQPNGTAKLTLWPETPTPFYFNHDPIFRLRMQQVARSSNGYFLFGFVDYKTGESDPSNQNPYNSVALLSPLGEIVSQYDKMHLVPFGEYVPYPSVFFFVEKISTEAGNFRPGNRVVVSELDNGHTVGGVVCYEAIVPDLVRQFARDGAQVLFNVTNDGWFGNSAAPYQHLNMARLRAIENHRYLLRAANNGISAVIDPLGRIRCHTRLNERVVLDGQFEFFQDQTFYTRFGDVFAWACMVVTMLGFIGTLSLKRFGVRAR
jgi:apolipoprotein N-acyltransferase